MHLQTRVIRLEVRQTASGSWVATSEDEPSFYISEANEESLLQAIPCVVEWLYRDREHLDVVVFVARGEPDTDEPYAAIVPKELVAQRALEGC